MRIARIAEEKKNAGNDEYKLKNYKQAEKYYTEAINLCPEQAAYYGNRAAALMMLNDYAAALTDAKLSTQLDHGFAKGYMRMAKCCLALGDMVGTKQAIIKFLEIDPRNTALKIEIQQLKQLQDHQEKATASYEKEDWRTCLFHMENSLKVSPACARFKVLKAECMAMLGRYEQASDIAIAVMQMDQFNAEAIYVRGLTLYYTDNLDKSITHFQRVVKLDNDHKKAFQMRQKSRNIKNLKEEGNQLFKEQKYREALKAYTEALTIDATNNEINSKLYYNRSLVNTKLGNLLDAIIDCTEALKRNDKYVKALMKRAKCYYDLEKYEECVKDYEALAKIQKTDEIRSALKNAKLQLKKSKRKDYYKILGIGKSANDDEIKKAYRKRALIHHPDRHANSTEEEKKEQEVKFKEVGEAYTVLSDPNKKSRYDNGQDLDDDGHGMDIDPNQMFRQFFSFTADDSGFPRGGHGGHQSGFNFHFG